MFLESLTPAGIHEAFRLSVAALNDDPQVLNATRVDPDMQYSDENPFEAHRKACTEMTYKYVIIIYFIRICHVHVFIRPYV